MTDIKRNTEAAERMFRSINEHNRMAFVKHLYKFEFDPEQEIVVYRYGKYYSTLKADCVVPFEKAWKHWTVTFPGAYTSTRDEYGEIHSHKQTQEDFEREFEHLLRQVECDEHYHDPDTDFYGEGVIE